MQEYNIQTEFGRFRVRREISFTYKGEYKQDDLKVGGKNFCVEFKWNKDAPEIAELQWLDTSSGGCEIDGKIIKKESTIHLFDLSVTILKVYTPVKYITLLDNSKISCELPRNKKGFVFINYYYFLFHNATWYDDKFHAYPKLEEERLQYESAKKNSIDPSKKPATFDFKNNDLNSLFEPIFETCNTWKEFIDKIEPYSNNDKCKYVFPWYMEAALMLTDKKALPMYWIIDEESRPILPYSKNTSGGGLRRLTSRKRRNNDDIHHSEIRNLPYFH